MQPETAKQCMNDIGVSRENAEAVAFFLANNRGDEAKQRLRSFRCEMMDELHAFQKKVDQLDWLIREIEKR